MRGARWLRGVSAVLAGLVVAGMTAWVAGAVYYSNIPGPRLRATLALLFVVATALSFILLRRRLRTLIGFFVVFGLIVLWWFTIPASNNRDWQPEVAVTPWATIAGDRVTIHGVRNLDYRTETDFVPHWEDRTYDLQKLDSVDLIAVYWAGKAIAHIMVSFGFEGKDYVAISIETRKERGESYSTIAGFFKQYELVYIVADERDLIRVRTNYRQPQEDVYVYRVRTPRANIRRVFLDYVQTMTKLRDRPQFYNTLTTNCTTGVRLHTRVNPESPPMSWKVLLSGYVPEYAYELGRLDTTRPFPELERISRVNERAHAADKDPAFSQRIREGLPTPK
jgi:Ca2+/Na+ antiporter